MHHDNNAPVDAFERHYRNTGVAPWVSYLRKYPLRAVGELLRDRVWLGTYTISPGVLSVRQFLSGADAQWLDAGLAAWLKGELAELAPSQFERNSAEGEYGIALYGAGVYRIAISEPVRCWTTARRSCGSSGITSASKASKIMPIWPNAGLTFKTCFFPTPQFDYKGNLFPVQRPLRRPF